MNDKADVWLALRTMRRYLKDDAFYELAAKYCFKLGVDWAHAVHNLQQTGLDVDVGKLSLAFVKVKALSASVVKPDA